MGKKKTKSKPIIAPTLATPLNTFVGESGPVGKIASSDPTKFVAPASELQNLAFTRAKSMFGSDTPNPYFTEALGMARAAGAAGAPTVGAGASYTPGTLGDAPSAARNVLGAAPGYAGATLDPAAMMGATALDPASMAGRVALDPAAMAGRVNIDPAALGEFFSVLGGGGIKQYMDPGLEAYVNSTLQGYDYNTAKQLAQLRAQGAGNKAFGGSRWGVQEGTFGAEAGLGRAQTEAGLRTKAFEDAAQLALTEAGRRTDLSATNAAAINERAARQAAIDEGREREYAAAVNTRGLRQGELDVERERDYANALNQFALRRAEMGTDREKFNADTLNRFAETQARLRQDAGLQTQNLQADFLSRQFGADEERAAADAARQADFATRRFDALNDANRYNADWQNKVAELNFGAQGDALNRQLDAARLYGDLAGNYAGLQRDDLATLLAMGGTQRDIDQQFASALPNQAELLAQLYGSMFPAYVGSKGTASGGLLGDIATSFAGGIGQGLGSTFVTSDRRLKEDIARIGDLGALGLYRFRYIGDDTVRIGVMADEVAEHMPEALGPPLPGGYATVDYGKLAQLMEA